MAGTIEIKSNADKVAQMVRDFDARLLPAMQLGLRKGMRLFEADIVKNQMTGRPGLNRRSGALAGSWFLSERNEGKNYSVTLANMPHAWYVVVHQHHMFNGVIRARNKPYLKFQIPGVGWRQAKEVRIPKRLHIPERFGEDVTTNRIHDSILKEVVKTVNRQGNSIFKIK